MEKYSLVILMCLVQSLVLAEGNSPPTNLRCEYLTNPVGIGTTKPRLSWQLVPRPRGLRQSAYCLLVASSETLLAKDTGDLWDTGRLESRRTSQVVYDGTPLKPGQTCYWKVKIWDEAGSSSGWSRPARWCVGPLGAARQ
jgi:alpha-L-rhamnosidase